MREEILIRCYRMLDKEKEHLNWLMKEKGTPVEWIEGSKRFISQCESIKDWYLTNYD